jgi:hypothetical protein
MRRLVVALVAVGVVTLAASAALAGDPAPTRVNGVVNPAVGQVVARLEQLPDGSCDLGADGITLTATPEDDTAPLAVEVGPDCVVTVVAAKDAVEAPGGQTVEATP